MLTYIMAKTEIPAHIHSETMQSSAVIAQNALYEQALGHEERVPHLVRLDLDEDKFPYQNVDTRYIDGTPVPIDEMHEFIVGNADKGIDPVEPRFPVLLETLAELENENGLLTRIGEHLRDDSNVILACEHEQVTDLGYLSIAYSEALQRMGYEFRRSIIAGKMIPYLGYEVQDSVVPLTDIMKMGGERIYLSYPPETKATLSSGIPAKEIRKNNVGMAKQLFRDLNEGGWLLAMDPLGATLRTKDGTAVFAAEGVSSGTLAIIEHPKTLFLAHGLLMSRDKIVFATDSRLRPMRGAQDLQDALDTEARLLNDRVNDVEFISPPLPAKLFSSVGRTAISSSVARQP